MPFEFYGTDISQPEARDAYLEVFCYFKDNEVEMPDSFEFGYDGMIEPWVQQAPEEAKAFVSHCSEHPNPAVRRAAAMACENFLEVDAEFTISTIEKTLSDEDPEVSSVYTYFDDILKGEEILFDFIEHSGILGTRRLIKAVQAAKQATGKVSV